MKTHSARGTSISSKMALLVHLATPSRDCGGDEEQPELPWSSEPPADALRALLPKTCCGGICFAVVWVAPMGLRSGEVSVVEETLYGDLGTSV